LAYAVLIITITSMVLVSIHPFALRKLFLVIVAFLCFSAFCFADPVLMVRRYSTHPPHIGAVSAPAPTSQGLQDVRLPNSELEALKSVDFSREQTKLQFTGTGNPGAARTTRSSIFGKTVCARRPLGLHPGFVAAPTLAGPGEI
jgi:hypothetical protein